MTIQGAIFDMDGTLLDSMEGWITAGEDYLRRRGIIPSCGKADSLMYQSMTDIAVHFQSAYGIKEDINTIIDGVNGQVRHYYETKAVLCDGVIDFLQMLKSRGVPMCVATATDRCLAQPVLERLGLLPFFDAIFTCTETGANKLQPLIYDIAREFMDTPKGQTWVFEDAAYAALTAKRAGYPVCAIYDRFETRADELRSCADCYWQSYSDAKDAPFL